MAKIVALKDPHRIAIVGIGNALNGDDAAGVEIVRRLAILNEQGRMDPAARLVIEAGLAPENFTGLLRRFMPDYVLLLDAAEMGKNPGTIRLLDWRDSAGFGASTHLQPLSTLAEYLVRELNCQVILLGIQPARLAFEQPLSTQVEGAVVEVTNELGRLLG